jgi:undecaprenyl-diphosphatase
MELFDIIALALIQGITEFLPISSSGHLALWPILSGRPDQGVTMDVAVHMGTLAAVCVYFRRDALQLLAGLADVLRGRVRTDAARLFLLVAIATIPAVIAGLALKLTGWIDALRVLEVIGWATLLGGLLLWYADRVGAQKRDAWGPDGGWGLHDAILMGLAQALALVPGTSRSGITMTMARWLGFGRTEAARLSVKDGNLALTAELGLGAALSFIAALVALSVMMRMFRRDWTMLPFVIYRLVLGVGLLGIAYS